MSLSPKPPRRVVVGTNKNGNSAIISDSDNPYQFNRGGGSTIYFNEIWTFDNCPINSKNLNDGADRPLSHSPPQTGAHFRVIESKKEDNKKLVNWENSMSKDSDGKRFTDQNNESTTLSKSLDSYQIYLKNKKIRDQNKKIKSKPKVNSDILLQTHSH